MRRHATAISTRPPAGWGARSAFGILCLCGLGLFALFAGRSTAGAAEACPNEAIRQQQGSQALPDCRAYEMVSPLDKGNGDINKISTSWSTADGTGLYFEALTSFAGGEGVAQNSQFIARRGGSSWETEGLNPYQTPDKLALVFPNEGFLAVSKDMTRGLLLTQHDPSDRTGSVANDQKLIYLREQGGEITRITPPTATPNIFNGPAFAGASADLDRVFFESNQALIPEAPPLFTKAAYEWHNGTLSMVGVLPDDTVADTPVSIGLNGGSDYRTPTAISGDGTQVVFSTGTPSQVYIRSNGETKLISASRRTGEVGTPAAHGATYISSASPDGDRLGTVYFASPDPLTNDAENNPEDYEASELYAYDIQAEQLTHVSKSEVPGITNARVLAQWVKPSPDGSHVYFLASEPLTEDASANEPQLYVWSNGDLRLLTRAGSYLGSQSEPARISTDGHRLSLRTDNFGLLDIEQPESIGIQIYVYDYPSDSWTCASCSPEGPAGEVFDIYGASYSGEVGAGVHGQVKNERTRNISPDGSRLYFETPSRLVPADTNGTFDVYEWRDGEARLLSRGEGDNDAHLLEITPDGRSVFLTTRERLVPQDTDSFVDAYVAKVGGGIPYHAPAPPCSADACQGTPSAPRGWSGAGSSVVQGPGNPKAGRKGKKCAKGKKKSRSARASGCKSGKKKAGSGKRTARAMGHQKGDRR